MLECNYTHNVTLRRVLISALTEVGQRGGRTTINSDESFRKFSWEISKKGKVIVIIPVRTFLGAGYYFGDIYVVGGTYPYRKILTKHGFKWVPPAKMWIYTYGNCLNELIDKLRWLISELPVIIAVITHVNTYEIVPNQFVETLGKVREIQ